MDDTVESWERWALALSGGRSPATGGLSSVEDSGLRRRPGDRLTESLADEELAPRFRRGDDQAFALLYARYRAPLLRFVRRTTPDPSDLEELVQEIWLAVIRGRERYMARARFVTYLFSIARRRSADRWRRHGVELDPQGNVDELETLPGAETVDYRAGEATFVRRDLRPNLRPSAIPAAIRS
ncbi:MAG: sigma-70 family RNA polymerase sigma factor [Chloroflexota bacterium]